MGIAITTSGEEEEVDTSNGTTPIGTATGPEIPNKRQERTRSNTNQGPCSTDTYSNVYIGTDLPLVFLILSQINYLPTPMQSPIVESLTQMGIVPMAQRVASRQPLIAGRLKLFLNTWRVITNNPWAIDCVQGYTIDLEDQPYQYQPPQELTFSPEETDCLSAEVTKMTEKHAIDPVPRVQAAKGFQSQLFAVRKGRGKETCRQSK